MDTGDHGGSPNNEHLYIKAAECSEVLQESQFLRELLTSTYSQAHIKEDIILSKHYILNQDILKNTPITESMRARIRSFLMSEGSKQWVMRDTLALACTYLDIYFLMGGYCSTQNIQSLSIACLILAMKVQEGKFPTISFNVFSKQELLGWQQRVAKRLQYLLNPPTYITFAEQITLKWTKLILDKTNYKSLVQRDCLKANLPLRCFYEQLDCIFMILKSLAWPLQSLVINLFYLHVRRLNFPDELNPIHLSSQNFVRLFYPHDEFEIFFLQFVKDYSKHVQLTLSPELGNYLQPFLALEPSTKEFPIRKGLENIRIWDKLQTCPKDCYTLSKSLMKK